MAYYRNPARLADPFRSDTLMDDSLPSCTLRDFKRPLLRKCCFDMGSISFVRRINPNPDYATGNGLDGGLDGYNWVVCFEKGGPEFVLKLVSRWQSPFILEHG